MVLLTRKFSEMYHDICLGRILLEKFAIESWNGLEGTLKII